MASSDPLDNYDVLRAVYERTRNYIRKQETALAEARELIKWLSPNGRRRGSRTTRKVKMSNDLKLQFYLEQAKFEQTKGAQWVMFAPRLAIEMLEELLRWRHIDAAAPKMSLQIARRNEDIPK